MEEKWKIIQQFWNYEISNLGRCRNHVTGYVLSMGRATGGAVTYNFRDEGRTYTRSAKLLVAEAWLPRLGWWDQDPEVFNSVIQLDYDPYNCRVDNLAWRPRWFVWQWKHQLERIDNPMYQRPVFNRTAGISYETIIDACLTEGRLFRDVFNCCGVVGQHGTWPDGDDFCFI